MSRLTTPLVLAGPPTLAACVHCAHALSGGAQLERAIPGLAVFGSGYGASIADSRLCQLHDRLVAPADHCAQFVTKAD
jgi:hypothetical protein